METQNISMIYQVRKRALVQGRFIQDHQNFGIATGEACKLLWIKRPQLSVEGVQKKVEVKPMY